MTFASEVDDNSVFGMHWSRHVVTLLLQVIDYLLQDPLDGAMLAVMLDGVTSTAASMLHCAELLTTLQLRH